MPPITQIRHASAQDQLVSAMAGSKRKPNVSPALNNGTLVAKFEQLHARYLLAAKAGTLKIDRSENNSLSKLEAIPSPFRVEIQSLTSALKALDPKTQSEALNGIYASMLTKRAGRFDVEVEARLSRALRKSLSSISHTEENLGLGNLIDAIDHYSRAASTFGPTTAFQLRSDLPKDAIAKMKEVTAISLKPISPSERLGIALSAVLGEFALLQPVEGLDLLRAFRVQVGVQGQSKRSMYRAALESEILAVTALEKPTDELRALYVESFPDRPIPRFEADFKVDEVIDLAKSDLLGRRLKMALLELMPVATVLGGTVIAQAVAPKRESWIDASGKVNRFPKRDELLETLREVPGLHVVETAEQVGKVLRTPGRLADGRAYVGGAVMPASSKMTGLKGPYVLQQNEYPKTFSVTARWDSHSGKLMLDEPLDSVISQATKNAYRHASYNDHLRIEEQVHGLATRTINAGNTILDGFPDSHMSIVVVMYGRRPSPSTGIHYDRFTRVIRGIRVLEDEGQEHIPVGTVVFRTAPESILSVYAKNSSANYPRDLEIQDLRYRPVILNSAFELFITGVKISRGITTPGFLHSSAYRPPLQELLTSDQLPVGNLIQVTIMR